ncbi:ATP-binding protein [Cryobacterium psychrophilum]|nr:ATP-binding protein [Cryobacterium psychrophilum]TDW29804.1 signal transduction histidine kinase [Cryobacterium psychrophilum]
MVLHRLSIRTRITMGTLLLAALFFGGAAFVVHSQVRAVLVNASTQLLKSAASPYVSAIAREAGEMDSPGGGQLITVVDPSGAVALSKFPRSLEEQIGSIPTDESDPQTITAGTANYLVLVTNVPAPAGTWHVYSAVNQAASRLVLAGITEQLGIALVLLTLVFGAASWLLTGAALRPVAQLRRSADSLIDSNSSETLPVGPANDEVQQLARTLNTLIVSLRAAAERERQLVSDASHELRTPVAILQAQLELIRTGDQSTLSSDLAAAERAVHRLGGLVSSLLALSRIEAGSETGLATVRELADELVAAVDRARSTARSTDITIDFELPSTADGARQVPISADEFGRIVDNLLGNAIHAMGDAGLVTASLTATTTGTVLTVLDSGPGIDEAFLPRALDRFSQAKPSRDGAAGTGLGLAIVAAAARAAHGTVTLSNVAGSGVSVVVSLPDAVGATETHGPGRS